MFHSETLLILLTKLTFHEIKLQSYISTYLMMHSSTKQTIPRGIIAHPKVRINTFRRFGRADLEVLSFTILSSKAVVLSTSLFHALQNFYQMVFISVVGYNQVRFCQKLLYISKNCEQTYQCPNMILTSVVFLQGTQNVHHLVVRKDHAAPIPF